MVKIKHLLTKLSPRQHIKKLDARHYIVSGLALVMVVGASVIAVATLGGSPDDARLSAVKNLSGKLLPVVSRYYLTQSDADKQKLLDQARSIATEREQKMEDLITNNPELAAEGSIPASVRAQLPSSVQSHVEKAVTIKGRLEAYGVDGFKSGQHGFSYSIKSNGKHYKLHKKGADQDLSLAQTTNSEYTVSGIELNQNIALSGNDSLQTTTTSSSTQIALGTKKTAVLLFNFNDSHGKNAEPITADKARTTVFNDPYSMRNFFNKVTFGKISIEGALNPQAGDVFGWYTIDQPSTVCNEDAWATAVKAKAAADGFNDSNYDNVIMLFPRTSACYWDGMGQLLGPDTWINGASFFNDQVVGHEMGHNYGLLHANSQNCTNASGNRVTLSDTCVFKEYEDIYDTMGNIYPAHYNVFNKGRLGVLSASNTQTVTEAGTYKIVPENLPGSGVMALRIPRGDNTYIYLSVRANADNIDFYASSESVLNGVLMHIAPGYATMSPTYIIDGTTNDSTGAVSDRALLQGTSFTDPKSGATVTVVSRDTTGATVSISLSKPIVLDTTPPSAPTQPTWTSSTLSDGRPYIYFNWQKSTDNVGVTGYDVYRDGKLLTSNDGYFLQDNIFINTSVTSGQSYNYYVVARDAAGNVSAPSPTITATTIVVSSDTTPPSTPTQLSATDVQTSQVNLSWQPSTDNVGVADYVIYRDNVELAKTTSRTFGDATVNPSTTYTYTVKAIDAAGNLSSASNAVTVTVPSSTGGGSGGGTVDTGGVAGTVQTTVRQQGNKQTVPVFNANVSVAEKNGFTLQQTTTDSSGGYLFSGLAPGTYELRVSKTGYHNTKQFISVLSGKVTLQDVSIR